MVIINTVPNTDSYQIIIEGKANTVLKEYSALTSHIAKRLMLDCCESYDEMLEIMLNLIQESLEYKTVIGVDMS